MLHFERRLNNEAFVCNYLSMDKPVGSADSSMFAQKNNEENKQEPFFSTGRLLKLEVLRQLLVLPHPLTARLGVGVVVHRRSFTCRRYIGNR
mmetsp:Transcript_15265/g.38828  ORF Transcript_15265/g.38828 Transcript_15265/m.38828 type:complete len:92 (+) Transcript_15265:65-340(+)